MIDLDDAKSLPVEKVLQLLAAGRQGLSAQEAGQREEDQDPIDSAMMDKGKAIPELVFPLLKPVRTSMPWN